MFNNRNPTILQIFSIFVLAAWPSLMLIENISFLPVSLLSFIYYTKLSCVLVICMLSILFARKDRLKELVIDLPIFLLFILLVLSIAVSQFVRESYDLLAIINGIIFIFMSFIAIPMILENEKSKSLCYRLISYVVATILIVTVFYGISIGEFGLLYSGEEIRIAPGSINPNTYAMGLVSILILNFVYKLLTSRKIGFSFAILFCLCFVACYLAVSRSALIMLTFFFIFYYLFQNKTVLFAFSSFTLTAIIIVLTTYDIDLGSISSGRFLLWNNVMSAWLEQELQYQVFGGVLDYVETRPNYNPNEINLKTDVFFDNTYINFIVNNGLIGFVLFCTCLVCLFMRIPAGFNGKTRKLESFLKSYIVCFAITSFYSTTFIGFFNVSAFLFIILYPPIFIYIKKQKVYTFGRLESGITKEV